MERVPGTVTIAPEVLVSIVQLTALDVSGVHAMSTDWTRGMNRFFGNERVGDGVQVKVEDNHVVVDLFVIVDHDVNMLQLGQTIQAEVTRAIVEMVGMKVRTVNVHIEDVCFPLGEA